MPGTSTNQLVANASRTSPAATAMRPVWIEPPHAESGADWADHTSLNHDKKHPDPHEDHRDAGLAQRETIAAKQSKRGLKPTERSHGHKRNPDQSPELSRMHRPRLRLGDRSMGAGLWKAHDRHQAVDEGDPPCDVERQMRAA